MLQGFNFIQMHNGAIAHPYADCITDLAGHAQTSITRQVIKSNNQTNQLQQFGNHCGIDGPIRCVWIV